METFYNIMLYGGLALAVIFAVIAIILFFALKIPKAVGDVTGRTARKKIEEIREKGYESVQGVGASKREAIKDHTSRISVRDIQTATSAKQAEKGRENYEKAVAEIKRRSSKIPDAYEEGTAVLPEGEFADDSESATDILLDDTGSESATDILSYDVDGESATDVLRDIDEEATDVLRETDEEATDVLRETDEAYGEEETNVLTADDSEEATDVLRGGEEASQQSRQSSGSVRLIKNIVVVHTNESI